jgi:hypothetical protein
VKAYVVTTGTIFATLTLAHVWRVVEEGSRLAKSPAFVFITLGSAALAVWAWRMARGAGSKP